MQAQAISKSDELPFELALRIRHPSLDPAELTRELHIEPKHSFRAGSPRETGGGPAAAAIHIESYWIGILDAAAWSADSWFSGWPRLQPFQSRLNRGITRSLGWALSLSAIRLSRQHAALFERIRVQGGQASLLVSLSPTSVDSFSLVPEVSRVFGELGITLEFEMMDG